MSKPTSTVQKIHFEDFDGTQFERLVFAYHARTDRWQSLEWYGQTGQDKGRDIWGIRHTDTPRHENVCILCANWGVLTSTKALTDIEKLLYAPTGKPDRVRVVTRSQVSADVRDKIKDATKTLGIRACDIWSGVEFEEFLRRDCETLLRRFVEGESFPDTADELTEFAHHLKASSDMESLALLARVFDRPAFTTRFQHESNLPAFKQAITDTIQAINTGVWQTREGKELGRLPSKHDLKNPAYRDVLNEVVKNLTKLRATFDSLVREQKIRPCGCRESDCPVYFLDPEASMVLDDLRRGILTDYRHLVPDFKVCLDALS